MPAPKLRTIEGQPSWTFQSDRVKAHLSRMGGQLAPVQFKLGRRIVQPFSISPWATEPVKTIPLLKALRGDFFCCPFGGNGATWRGETHPAHGETAQRNWSLRSINRTGDETHLHAQMTTKVRRGRVDKHITLIDGHTAIYQRHVISGMSGPMAVGNHPTLRFPDAPASGLISTSQFIHGQVYPGSFESPENKGYQSLKPGAIFRSLDRVPLIAGGFTDLSRFPARRGFEDLAMLCADPSLPFAWSAVVFPNEGYVWFSIRDPRVLRNTVLWISNGGRHYSPWNGRHFNVMGIEDTTSHFHDGLAESASPNGLNRRGIPTVLKLDRARPTTISHVMAVAAVPRGFDHVADIRQVRGGVELISRSKRRVRCPLRLEL